MRVTNHINKSNMKVKELIEALSYYDGDDNITFYFLKNDTLTNCQVEDISFYSDTMGVEFTIQDTSEVEEEHIDLSLEENAEWDNPEVMEEEVDV